MKRAIASQCYACAYRERHIYVVGAFRFEREVVADYIRTHTPAKWFQVESLESIAVSNQGVPLGKKMILIDTMTMTRDNMIQLLSSKIWQSHAHNLMALFNLPHEYAIEKSGLKSGVRGFFYDDDRAEDLVNGICTINAGEIWASRRILSEYVQDGSNTKELRPPNDQSLSEREIELLQVLAVGASNEVIANQMGISPHTVKSHLYNIFHKINAENRLQAALWAQKNL